MNAALRLALVIAFAVAPLVARSQSSAARAKDTPFPDAPLAHTAVARESNGRAEQLFGSPESHGGAGGLTVSEALHDDPPPLSPAQKFQLFVRSQTAPWPVLSSAAAAGLGQARDIHAVWGQGLQGYSKRFRAAYADSLLGNFFANAALPAALHEDPRYFREATGRKGRRALWAAGSAAWRRRDDGSWGPNYANVLGNMIGAAVARAYYPASERTVGHTVRDGFLITAQGVVGAEVLEFWPDIAVRLRRRLAHKMSPESAD